MRPFALLPLLLAAGACARQVRAPGAGTTEAPVRALAITSADQLVAAMHDRYAKSWYRTITFVQKSTYFRDGAPARVETWYEAGALPGRLRIDLGEPSRGNGVLYRADSVYTIQGGHVADTRAGRNALLILGFDVYRQPPARTLEQLKAEHVDITLLHVDSLDGHRVYVVGAGPTDSTSNQFWVDADRMLFLRLIQRDARRAAPTDIRFEQYVKHDGGWVAHEVRVLSGGQMVFHEEYSSVRVNVPLSDDLFLPEKWAAAPHWYTP